MNPETEHLIRESWALLEPRSDALMAAFYERLFEIAPEVRPLFSTTDMNALHQKFSRMLREIVMVVDDPSRLVWDTAACGRQHVYYGADPKGYQLVGSALLWAIEQELGPAYTPEVRDAWRELYRTVSAVMIRAGDLVGTASRSSHGSS